MNNNQLSWVCSGVTIVTGIVAQDILQVVLLVLGGVSTLVSLLCNIYIWYKKAKQDGKIDNDELNELKNIVDKHDKGE